MRVQQSEERNSGGCFFNRVKQVSCGGELDCNSCFGWEIDKVFYMESVCFDRESFVIGKNIQIDIVIYA